MRGFGTVGIWLRVAGAGPRGDSHTAPCLVRGVACVVWDGVMLVRILQFVLGALAGAGGGYLLWMNRADLGSLFPPGPGGPPWMIVAGALGVAAGVVFLVSAVHPRPNRRREIEAREARRAAHLGEAEAYYAEAGRAADRDWRSGDILAPAASMPVAPEPVATQAPVQPAPVPPPAQPAAVAPAPQPPSAPPVAVAPSQPVKAVATAAAPEPAAPPPAAPASAFPSTASLAPIPVAAEPPPAIPTVSEPVVEAYAPDPHAAIRSALKAGQLAEAERLLEAGRETAKGLALAELTGLAGDHAAAAGRQSHAKWLWRLAIKRFGEEGALDTPAAKAVSESLRVTG